METEESVRQRQAEHFKRTGLMVFDPMFVVALDRLAAFWEIQGYGKITLDFKDHRLRIITQQQSITIEELIRAITGKH